MTTRELLEVLGRIKTAQAYAKTSEPIAYPIVVPEIVDWSTRMKEKNKLFIKHLGIIGISFSFSVLFGVLPFWLVDPSYGKSVMMGLPPMFLMAFSWMLGAWWAFDKDRLLFMGVTMGVTPLRLFFCAVWAAVVCRMPGIHLELFIFSMMIYWVLFTVSEIAMLIEFTKKLPCTSRLEGK